jgi:hypothetical protein
VKVDKSLAFLNNAAGDWRACLDVSLAYLRQSWDGQRTESGDGARDGRWVGLPFLVDACADFLGIGGAAPGATSATLIAVARQVAAQIEAEGGCGVDSAEPGYHNRLHFSDSLTTITLQAAIESQRLGVDDADWKAALLLIALGHDFRHPGRVNGARAEIEQQSFDALKPYLQQHAVPALWVERIEAVILRSDFSMVADNHQRVADLPFSWCTDWAAVLLNEADIMASASPDFGPRLSRALAAEWELIGFAAYRSVATPQGRSAFLQSIEFSSPSAGVLGAAQRVRQQLADAAAAAQAQP